MSLPIAVADLNFDNFSRAISVSSSSRPKNWSDDIPLAEEYLSLAWKDSPTLL